VLETAKALLETRVEEHLTDADAHAQRSSTYDPGVVFLLEVMLSASEHGREYIYDLWCVDELIRKPTSLSIPQANCFRGAPRYPLKSHEL
jgi:hypothetical protein